MSDAANQGRERRRLIALYDETQNENFLRAAKCLDRGGDGADIADILMAPDQKKRGNPEINDREVLLEMALLMEREGLSRWAAAEKMASENPGYSVGATAKRLDRKFREGSADYIWIAREIIGAQERARVMSKALLGAQKRQRGFDLVARSVEKFHSILKK